MRNRSTSRLAAVDFDDDEEIVADGLVARIADHAFDNPAMSGGLIVMAMTAVAIVSNAMFLQTGRHPEPLFATRPAAVSAPVPVPVPRERVSTASTAVATPPIPRQPPAKVVASQAPEMIWGSSPRSSQYWPNAGSIQAPSTAYPAHKLALRSRPTRELPA